MTTLDRIETNFKRINDIFGYEYIADITAAMVRARGLDARGRGELENAQIGIINTFEILRTQGGNADVDLKAIMPYTNVEIVYNALVFHARVSHKVNAFRAVSEAEKWLRSEMCSDNIKTTFHDDELIYDGKMILEMNGSGSHGEIIINVL